MITTIIAIFTESILRVFDIEDDRGLVTAVFDISKKRLSDEHVDFKRLGVALNALKSDSSNS